MKPNRPAVPPALRRDFILRKLAAESAERSLFGGEFWRLLMEAVRLTNLSPPRLLSPNRRPRVPAGPAWEAVAALRAVECPFGVHTSEYGWDSLLRSLRAMARRIGLPNAETIDFDNLI